MPRYDYNCESCGDFEITLPMSERLEKCPTCGSEKVKKMFKTMNFSIDGGTQNFSQHGYTGRRGELVKKLKGNKSYQEGYRREIKEQERAGLRNLSEEQKMQAAQETFRKMKAEGEKMTDKEKNELKEKYGIKKGMKDINLKL